jgi:urocanate hydratase
VKVCLAAEGLPPAVEAQYRDNLRWIREAHQHHLVVGSQARILYSDRLGRISLALAFNCAVKDGTLQVGDTRHVVQMSVELLEFCR